MERDFYSALIVIDTSEGYCECEAEFVVTLYYGSAEKIELDYARLGGANLDRDTVKAIMGDHLLTKAEESAFADYLYENKGAA